MHPHSQRLCVGLLAIGFIGLVCKAAESTSQPAEVALSPQVDIRILLGGELKSVEQKRQLRAALTKLTTSDRVDPVTAKLMVEHLFLYLDDRSGFGHDDDDSYGFAIAQSCSRLGPQIVPYLETAIFNAESKDHMWLAVGCLVDAMAIVNVGLTKEQREAVGLATTRAYLTVRLGQLSGFEKWRMFDALQVVNEWELIGHRTLIPPLLRSGDRR